MNDLLTQRGYIGIWCSNKKHPVNRLFVKLDPDEIIDAMKKIKKDKMKITNIEEGSI